MPLTVPKIVWPADSSAFTLNFAFPPVEKPVLSDAPDEIESVRNDLILLSGLRQTMFYRQDFYKRLVLKYVDIASEMENWKDFMLYAQTGGSFLYYPDATDEGTFSQWILEDSGGSARSQSTSTQSSVNWNPKWAFYQTAEFEIVMRKVLLGAAPTLSVLTPASFSSDNGWTDLTHTVPNSASGQAGPDAFGTALTTHVGLGFVPPFVSFSGYSYSGPTPAAIYSYYFSTAVAGGAGTSFGLGSVTFTGGSISLGGGASAISFLGSGAGFDFSSVVHEFNLNASLSRDYSPAAGYTWIPRLIVLF